MIRREDHDRLVVFHLGEKEGQEVGQVAVEPVVHVFGFDRLGAVGFAYAARGIQADVQQVGRRVGAQLELRDRLLGEVQHGRVAGRRVEQPFVVVDQFKALGARCFAVVFLARAARWYDVPVACVAVVGAVVERAPRRGDIGEGVVFTVVAGDPFGQGVRIVIGGRPAGMLRIEPEHLVGASAHHYGRFGFSGHRYAAALGYLAHQRFA